MTLTPAQLRVIPLLRSVPDAFLSQVSMLFTRISVEAGTVLFKAGDPASTFYLLEEGEVALKEDGEIRIVIHPPAPIGELGALTALIRNTTAIATRASKLWQVTSEKLVGFFEANPDVAFPFYHELLQEAADKIQRDQVRLEDMRKNIIRTQKEMKQLRDYVLQSQDTPISDTVHDALEKLIQQNRRVNYRVGPQVLLPAHVRFDDGTIAPVVEVSRTRISFARSGAPMPELDSTWSGVLQLSGPEIPISGKIVGREGDRADLELDLLIDEFSAIFDGYLTRVQLLDFLV
ncbi:MAG: Crp/Fnr family transcriptional regulator [Bradymonadales bacterium]|nr:Crp/Fnr family transcriptional regulator [Bradymonadales bacterium]